MKQKLLSFLFVLIGLLGNRASVLAQDDSFFEIATAEDLVAFSEYVNAGNYGANAVLTADIDMSSVENFTGIGVARNALYSGTFDGQGHKISGMTISYPEKEDVGFFHIAKATLKNFWLDETCLIEGDKGVALVGWCNGDSPVLEGIGVAAKIKGSENTSSFIGRAWKNPQFKNCWSIGEIDNSIGSGNKTNTGVFMGWCNTWGGSFTNCWTTATFAIAPADANYLTRKGDNVTFNNCYSLYGSQAKRMTEDDVTNGALCYALNGDQSEITWYQTLGVDPYPVLDNTHGIVYLAEGIGCDGRAKGDVPFTNTDLGISSEPDPHIIVDGLCSVCGQLPQAEDGFYEIASPAALVKFSEMVNAGNVALKGRLTKDINMSGVENFTPIGLYRDAAGGFQGVNINFRGEFDGGKHVISNLTVSTEEYYEAGLFSRVWSGKVWNLGMENVTVSSNNTDGRIGGIAGFNREGTFTNCWTAGTITLTCTAENPGTQIGGIAGNTNNSKGCFVNCWSTYEGQLAPGSGTKTNSYEASAEDAASGALCYALNTGAEETIYYQAIGTDKYPAFVSSDSRVVYKTSEAGWGTFFDPAAAYKFPGVKAYTGQINDKWLKLTEVSQANAGTPVILKGSYYNKVAADSPAEMPENDLQGTTTELTADGTQYVLAKPVEGEIGFYPAIADSKIPAGKAYLNITGGSVKAFYFDSDDATSINEELRMKNKESVTAIYNLAGQRLNKIQKGINIVNGKKILK